MTNMPLPGMPKVPGAALRTVSVTSSQELAPSARSFSGSDRASGLARIGYQTA